MSTGLYHIHPATGDPGNCSAKKGNCPFGNDDTHYTSSEAAREAFELMSLLKKEESLKAWKRKSAPEIPAQQRKDSSGGHGRPVSSGRHGR